MTTVPGLFAAGDICYGGSAACGAVMAGQIAPLIKKERPATDIIDDALREAKDILEYMNEFVF